ncbi:hypothetical protein [Streptomyces kronopolitis]
MGIRAQLPSTSCGLPRLEALQGLETATAQLPEASSAFLIHINR